MFNNIKNLFWSFAVNKLLVNLEVYSRSSSSSSRALLDDQIYCVRLARALLSPVSSSENHHLNQLLVLAIHRH